MTEPPPKCTLGIRFQQMNLGRHKHSAVSTMEHFHCHHLCYHLADSSFASWSFQESEVPRCLVINGCWVWENESQVLLSLVGTTQSTPEAPGRIGCSPHIDLKAFCPRAPLCLPLCLLCLASLFSHLSPLNKSLAHKFPSQRLLLG